MNRSQWTTVTTADYHTGGEPFRIVTGGVPELVGDDVGERRLWAAEHLDDVRQLLVNEPRGHADMYGCFVTPPDDDDGDLGVVFFHNQGYSTACGHGTIALATWAVDTGLVQPGQDGRALMVVDAPSGRLRVAVTVDDDGAVTGVTFTNVASFVKAAVNIDIGEGRTAPVTIAFGGAFYAIVQATDVDLPISTAALPTIIEWCRNLKNDLNTRNADNGAWVHPVDPRLRDIYGVIVVEEVEDAGRQAIPLGGPPLLTQRNLTVFADGEVDRSATGSGTSARLAALHRDGRLATGQGFRNVSLIGSEMSGVVESETRVGPYQGVTTRIGGSAYATGTHEFFLDPRDNLGTGFLLR